MASINPAKFIREVRQEMGRVTWPTRKETLMFTMMVLVLTMVASAFFVFIDWFIGTVVGLIIGM